MTAFERCMAELDVSRERLRLEIPGFAMHLDRQRQNREFEARFGHTYIPARTLNYSQQRYGLNKGDL